MKIKFNKSIVGEIAFRVAFTFVFIAIWVVIAYLIKQKWMFYTLSLISTILIWGNFILKDREEDFELLEEAKKMVRESKMKKEKVIYEEDEVELPEDFKGFNVNENIIKSEEIVFKKKGVPQIELGSAFYVDDLYQNKMIAPSEIVVEKEEITPKKPSKEEVDAKIEKLKSNALIIKDKMRLQIELQNKYQEKIVESENILNEYKKVIDDLKVKAFELSNLYK